MSPGDRAARVAARGSIVGLDEEEHEALERVAEELGLP